MSITNSIPALLAARELSREECARRINLSPKQLSRIIAGVSPKLDIVFALEAVLETPIQKIFHGDVQTRRVR